MAQVVLKIGTPLMDFSVAALRKAIDKELFLGLDYHWPVVIQTQIIISEVPRTSKILERLAQRHEGTPQVTI